MCHRDAFVARIHRRAHGFPRMKRSSRGRAYVCARSGAGAARERNGTRNKATLALRGAERRMAVTACASESCVQRDTGAVPACVSESCVSYTYNNGRKLY
jgi:hypothetical protein